MSLLSSSARPLATVTQASSSHAVRKNPIEWNRFCCYYKKTGAKVGARMNQNIQISPNSIITTENNFTLKWGNKENFLYQFSRQFSRQISTVIKQASFRIDVLSTTQA